MADSFLNKEPLISVVVPCYNHAKYLHTAINSILNQQEYTNYEIIIVDDGSVDNTKEVAASFPQIKYIYQQNAGLSAARNTGLAHSKGKYLIFLDADDWLLPHAMATNAKYLMGHDEIAFVSGAYEYLYEEEGRSEILGMEVWSDHYCAFLESNYIGMHATVLYNRWVFDFVQYDTTLKACEDYDIYLKIAREYPVVHHNSLIAVYRIHHKNMSGNILLMLESSTKVLRRQQKYLRNEQERTCYEKGLKDWRLYYEEVLFDRLIDELENGKESKGDADLLKQLNTERYSKYLKIKNRFLYKKNIGKILPGFIIKFFSKNKEL